MPPAITIFLPARNEERHLEQTLLSLLGQTLADFRLIVSNNHSTDRTQEIIDTYARRDPRILPTAPGTSVSAKEHFDFGRTWFDTKYHMFAGAHDIFDKNYLLKTYQAMESNPNLIVAGSQCLHFTNDNKIFPIPSINFDSTGLGKLEKLCIFLQGTSYNNLAYGLYRSELARDVISPTVIGTDHLEMARHLMKGDCAVVPETLLYFRYPENVADPKRQIQSLGAADGAQGWRDLFIALRELIDENFTGVQQIYGRQMIKGIYMTHYLYMTQQLGISVQQAAQIAEEVMNTV